MSITIIRADEMTKMTDMTQFDEACSGVMKDIKSAAEAGKREVVFDPRPTSMYNAAKAEFEKHGYTFHPIGVIGGVRQLGEMICW